MNDPTKSHCLNQRPNVDHCPIVNEYGELTEAGRAAIHKCIGDEPHDCPCCDGQLWEQSKHVLTDAVIDDPEMTVPYVAYFCKRCGYTDRFNLITMGLMTWGEVQTRSRWPKPIPLLPEAIEQRQDRYVTRVELWGTVAIAAMIVIVIVEAFR